MPVALLVTGSLPGFSSATTLAFLHPVGILFVLVHFLKTFRIQDMLVSPKCWIISVVILSRPHAFLVFIKVRAFLSFESENSSNWSSHSAMAWSILVFSLFWCPFSLVGGFPSCTKWFATWFGVTAATLA